MVKRCVWVAVRFAELLLCAADAHTPAAELLPCASTRVRAVCAGLQRMPRVCAATQTRRMPAAPGILIVILAWQHAQSPQATASGTARRHARPWVCTSVVGRGGARGGDGRALRLAACGGVTDGVLAAAVPPGVRELSVVCCERVTGWGLTRLRALRTLRLDGCPAVDVAAVQARARAVGRARFRVDILGY
jgi:hypothetical protein